MNNLSLTSSSTLAIFSYAFLFANYLPIYIIGSHFCTDFFAHKFGKWVIKIFDITSYKVDFDAKVLTTLTFRTKEEKKLKYRSVLSLFHTEMVMIFNGTIQSYHTITFLN